MSLPWPQVWERVAGDPLLLYSLAATALLAIVSWSSGLGRADVAALLRPRTMLRVAGAVAVSFLITVAARTFADGSGTITAAALLEGVGRLPLYLVTLAYGPTIGIVAAALSVGFAADASLPGWREAILTLELVVLGWLAIYPSPRQTRWAGPFDVTLAHLLAWGTGGVALMAYRFGEFSPQRWRAEVSADLVPVAVAVLALLAFGPRFYQRAFPGSRIAAGPAEPAPPAVTTVHVDTRVRARFAEVDLSAVPDLEDAAVHAVRAGSRSAPTLPLPAGESFDAGRDRDPRHEPWARMRPVPASRRASIGPKRRHRLRPMPPLEDDPRT